MRRIWKSLGSRQAPLPCQRDLFDLVWPFLHTTALQHPAAVEPVLKVGEQPNRPVVCWAPACQPASLQFDWWPACFSSLSGGCWPACRNLLLPPLPAPLDRSHGPVWRTMLMVDRERSGLPGRTAVGGTEYGYSLHWPGSGESACFGWHDMPAALLAAGCGGSSNSGSHDEQPLLSGPLWLGPLHSLGHLRQVHAEAEERGWLQAGAASSGSGPALPATRKGGVGSLQQLLGLMLEEAEAEEAAASWPRPGSVQAVGSAQTQQQQQGDTQEAGGQEGQQQQQQQRGLPPWYLRMNDVGRAGALMGPPSRDALAEELRRRWGLKTTCDGLLACLAVCTCTAEQRLCGLLVLLRPGPFQRLHLLTAALLTGPPCAGAMWLPGHTSSQARYGRPPLWQRQWRRQWRWAVAAGRSRAGALLVLYSTAVMRLIQIQRNC